MAEFLPVLINDDVDLGMTVADPGIHRFAAGGRGIGYIKLERRRRQGGGHRHRAIRGFGDAVLEDIRVEGRAEIRHHQIGEFAVDRGGVGRSGGKEETQQKCYRQQQIAEEAVPRSSFALVIEKYRV